MSEIPKPLKRFSLIKIADTNKGTSINYVDILDNFIAPSFSTTVKRLVILKQNMSKKLPPHTPYRVTMCYTAGLYAGNRIIEITRSINKYNDERL